MINAVQCGFLGIILGHKQNNNKIGFSILFGFLSYMLSQTFVLLCVFLVGIFNSSIMDLFKSNVLLDISSLKLLIVLAVTIYLLIIVFMSVICKKVFNKGVDIE